MVNMILEVRDENRHIKMLLHVDRDNVQMGYNVLAGLLGLLKSKGIDVGLYKCKLDICNKQVYPVPED